MAVYRESTPIWRRRLPLILGVMVIFVALFGIGLVLRSRSEPGSADSRLVARSSLDLIAQSVDLFDIEYAKILKGTSASQTGAPGAINKALEALAAQEAVLRPLNTAAYRQLQIYLTALASALNASPQPDLSDKLAGTLEQVQILRKSLNSQ